MEKIYKNASWDATKISFGFKYLFFISCMFMVGSVWGQINYYSKAIATDFNNTSSWGTNTDGTGTSPASISSADNYVIQNGSNMTLTGNASVRALTINAGSLTVSANTLTVTIASANNSQLLIAGGTLNLSSTGNIILNGNFSMTSGAFNQSGGSIVLDGNNSNIVASTVASGTNLFSISGGTPACSAGSITIVDPPLNTIATGSGTVHRSISISLSAGTNYFTGSHTFILGDGVSTTPGNTDGFVIETYASGYAPLQNVTVNGGNTTGRWGTASYNNATTYGCHIKGDLIINSNSEFRQQYASGLFAVGGNIVNNGILTVQGTAAASGLTLGTNSAFTTTNAQIVSGSGTFRNATTSPTANYSFLTINNTSAGGVTFSSAQSLLSGTNTGTVSGTLTLTNGIISTNGGTFILGTTGTSAGTLSYTAGGFTSGSSFSRWHTTTGTGATILASTLPSGTSTGIWPFVTGNPVSGMFSRHFYRNTTALTTAGRITVQYNDGTGFTSASLTDGAYTVNQLSNANWVVTNVGTAGTATPSYSIIANQLFNTTSANPRLIANGAVVGTQMAGLSNPVAQRSAIPTANQFSTFRIGINSVDVLNSTIASGSFDNPAIWSSGSVPACGSLAAISSSDSVWVNSGTTVTAGSILNNGRLSINGGTLTLGCNNNDSLTNNGRLYIASGTLYMNGNINNQSGSRFWQTGGNIYISGNSGSVATSVRTGVPLLWMQSNDVTLTGGTLNILRPHIGTATADRAITYVPTSTPYPNITGDHTLQFGDGVSTVSGGTNGFTIATGTRFQSGNMVINTNASPNVRVTTTGSYVIHGNLTITKGRFEIATGNTLVLAGNLTNNDTLITVGTLSFAKVLNANMSTPTTSPDSSVQTVSGTGRIFNNTTPASATANFSAITINNRQGFGGVTFANAFNQIGIQPANTISASGVLTFTLGTATTSSGVTFLLGSFGATPAVATAPSFTSGGFTSGSSFGYYMVAATTGTTTITSGTATSSTGFGRFPFVSSTGMDRSAWFERPSTGSAAGFIAATYNQVAGTTTGLTIADANSYTVTQRANDNWSFNTLGSTPSATSYEIAISAPNVFGASLSADSTRIVQASSAIGTYQRGTLLPHGQRVLTLSDLTSGAFYLGANDNEIPNSSVQSGDWNTASTWSKGVPTCTDNAIIQTGHTVTVSSAANAKNVEIQQGGVLTHNAGGALTVGCTLNNNLFSIKGGTFNMNAGTLSVNGKFELTANVNGIFNQSGGDIIVDGNSGSTSTSTTAHAVDLYCHTTSTLSLTGGTFTVVDPVASTTTGNCAFKVYPTVAHASGANWTLKLGNGTSTNPGGNTDGFLLNLTNSNSFAIGGDVILNNSSTWATNRHVTTSGSIPIKNLTITKGDWRFSSTHYISGNIVNNDTLTHHSTSSNLTLSNYSGTTASASTNAQTIGGTGVFRNNTTNASVTANLLGITINNTNATGVTLNVPLSVSGTLTMTSGIINTTSTNLLRLGTTSAAGTLSGTPSNTNFINGPFARTFPISRSSSAFSVSGTLFPVGVSGATPALMSMDINPVTNATGPVIFTVQANNSMSGTAGSGVSNLASVTWSAIPDNTANLTSAQVRLNRADLSVTTTSKILYAAANTDPFEGIPGGSTGTASSNVSGSTQILTADYKNHFSYGDLVVCTAPSDQASNLLATNKTTTSFTATFDPGTNTTGYLVVRYTGTFTPTTPVDGTIYAAGTGLGGTVIGNYYSAPFTFNQTGLTANTAYTYKIYSFNNTGCAGPVYNATSYDATVTTCATAYNAPTSISASNVTTNSMDINFTASTSSGVQDHYIDVATNNTFTNFVSGYQNLQLGFGASAGPQVVNVSGLNPATSYFIRIKATDGAGCESVYTTTLIQATDCNALTTFPFSENFDAITTPAIPSCWTSLDANIDGDKWITYSGYSKSGSISVGLYTDFNSGANNDYLILPKMTLSGAKRLKYSVRARSSTEPNDYRVVLSTTGKASTDFTTVVKPLTTVSNTVYEDFILDLSAYSGDVYIAFHVPSGGLDGYYLYLDDIVVEDIPAPTITSVTSSNQCGGSTKIVITGTDMSSISSASIGSQSLLPFDSTSSTRLVKTITSPLNGTTSITNNIGTATNASTITFTNAPALSVDSPNFKICNGSSAMVNVTSTLTDYTSYTWSPATGVSGSTSAAFNPTTTTTYTLNALNTLSGCVNSLTRTVTVDEMPSAISLSQGRTTPTCYSGFDSLMVSGGMVIGFSGKIGSGTASNTTSTPFRRFFGGSKTQALYTPTELASLGLVSGSEISSIGWVALSGTPAAMTNMNISIGLISTTLSSTSFATSPTNIVFSSASYTPSTGIGNLDFTLSSPLIWDGISHLLIETCHNDGDGGLASSNNISVESSTVVSGLNIYNSLDNNANVCTTTTGTTTTTRPNLRISFSKPATYSWSPTTGLFTNRATTTAYSGTSLNKVYSKPTASQKYYLTATNGACQRRDSIVDSIKNASNLVVLASSSASGAVEQCTDANGWTYYGTAANPDEWLFGIYKNGNNFTATVDITVDNVNKFRKSASSNGANQEHASYIMSRNWNVNATGTVGSGVKVRFFIDPQDITDLLDERDNDYDLLKNTTNPNTLAVTGGFEWFKTVGTTYNPSNWTGNKHNGAIVKLTEEAVGTLNGQTYVELSGITSFSGGSGGTAFGPSNNGLFNNGGVVGLPVTWKDVKATAKENGNFVQWATSSEKNTKSFVVEYSYDAKEFFEASKDILAAGNSATDRFYEFNHEEEYAELVYYRIKQIDLDGKVDYSKTVVVKRTSRLPEFHVSMYPVPLNIQDLTLRIQTIQKTDIAISINDLLGRSVYSQTISPAGYNTEHKMNLSHLPHGTYHVTINNGVNKSVQVLVVGK